MGTNVEAGEGRGSLATIQQTTRVIACTSKQGSTEWNTTPTDTQRLVVGWRAWCLELWVTVR